MYPLVHELFPYLILFYALDSFVYVRAHQWLLASLAGPHLRLRGAGLYPAGLSPAAHVVLCEHSPLVFAEDGVFVPRGSRGDDPPAELEFHAFETLSDLSVRDRALLVRGRTLWKAGSVSFAHHLREQLAELAALPLEARRDRLARLFSAETDLARVRERRQAQKREVQTLDAVSSACWMAAFLVLPLSLYTEWAWRPDALLVVGLVTVLGLIGAVLAHSALRDLGLSRRERLRVLTPLLLFPPAVLHLSSFVWRELFQGFDRLAVAAVLLDPEALGELARREMRRLRARRAAGGARQEMHWSLRQQAYERLLSQLGLDPKALSASPAAVDPSAATYCPLCSTEYRAGFEVCSDCGCRLERLAPA